VRARRDVVEIKEQPAATPSVAVTAAADPSDEAEAEVEEELEPQPKDPIEDGDCSFFVSLTSAETGAPVASSVKLFRLGAPGNEHWTRGDQLQADVKVPKEGIWIHRLPEGVYRIHAAAQRHPSDDPFRFTVRGSVTEKQFALPMPREFHARLVIVDERGRPVLSGRRRKGFSSGLGRTVKIPWHRERRLRHPDLYVHDFRFGCGGGVGGRRWWHDVKAVDGAFDLGSFIESPRNRRRAFRSRFQVEDRTEVRLRHEYEPGRDQTWMAIIVEPRPIEDTILYPDGSLATRARVRIHADAVLVPSPAPPSFWRTLTVNVRVSLEGFEELKFAVNPSDPPKMRYLRPAPPPTEG